MMILHVVSYSFIRWC